MNGYRFCVQCGGASVHRVKRHWWQRLLKNSPQYRCEDCGIINEVSTESLRPTRKVDQDTSDTIR